MYDDKWFVCLQGDPETEEQTPPASVTPEPAAVTSSSTSSNAPPTLVIPDTVHETEETMTSTNSAKSTPRSTPEPTAASTPRKQQQTNKNKAKAKKEKEDSKPTTPKPVEEVEEPKKAPPPQQQKQKPKKLDVGEIISVVKKTSFDDSEAQHLIDVLLSKHSGVNANADSSWVDTANDASKNLQKQLNEARNALDEEIARGKSLTDRVKYLRTEVTAEKTSNATLKRTLDDVNARHAREVQNFNMRLDENARAYNQLNESLMYQIGQTQNLQATLEQQRLQQQQPQIDPAFYAEHEALKGAKVALEAEHVNMQAQLAAKEAAEVKAKTDCKSITVSLYRKF